MADNILEYSIYPVLGLKTDVPANSEGLFVPVSNNSAMVYDTGGINIDYTRKRQTCTKAKGYVAISTANSQATKCLGLFQTLPTSNNNNKIMIDNGKFYYIDKATLTPTAVEDSDTTTFANNNIDLYTFIQIGDYVVFTDRGEHTPYKWMDGDSTLSKLIASGTEYKFRYIESFQRRVIGVYSDQTNGDIEVRYSTSWPSTDISALNFPATNQLYIPNDDSITGIKRMGRDRCFIYSENSIHSLDYYPDYESPFYLRNVNDGQGAAGNHAIVNLGDRHYLFNRNYGFCEFRGTEFPYGGSPISKDIESDVQTINSTVYETMCGTYVPFTREVCWAVPLGGAGYPTHLLFYNVDTKQWRKEDKKMRYVDSWDTHLDYTWEDFIVDLGGTGSTWPTSSTAYWGSYTSEMGRLVYAYEDGIVYAHYGDHYASSNHEGYREEPILDFGDSKRFDLLGEIWFDMGYNITEGDEEFPNDAICGILVWHRSGDTVGELEGQTFTLIGSFPLTTTSQSIPVKPMVRCNKSARLHQIAWGNRVYNSKFEVHKITFKYIPQSRF